MTQEFKILKTKRLLAQIDEYELDAPAGFGELTVDYIADNYNGAGPDWMPDDMRHVITWLLSLFEPAFLIHDMEFSASNRTTKGFIAANSRMWRNISKIINLNGMQSHNHSRIVKFIKHTSIRFISISDINIDY